MVLLLAVGATTTTTRSTAALLLLSLLLCATAAVTDTTDVPLVIRVYVYVRSTATAVITRGMDGERLALPQDSRDANMVPYPRSWKLEF